jgi:ribonucleotide monophosphatase NagD (HAD superfamily)
MQCEIVLLEVLEIEKPRKQLFAFLIGSEYFQPIVGYMSFAVVLDVDGVLYKDFVPIPGAIETLKLLGEMKIPHIFLTNSTGQSEGYKRKQYEDVFNIKIEEKQVIMAHTPLRKLDSLKGKRILVIGAEIGDQRKIALSTLES